MTSLKEKFLEAEGYLAQSKVQMSETIKLRLYGLTKQIKEGDCKMPQPPRYVQL
jgi:acyl-CoA-binding protein